MVCAGHPDPPLPGCLAILCIAVGAGASGALNMAYDGDIDALMRRTRARPVPAGVIGRRRLRLRRGAGPVLGHADGLAVNWRRRRAAGLHHRLLRAGLHRVAEALDAAEHRHRRRRRRPAPRGRLGGGDGDGPLNAWLLFAIIFMWTPPHFWALSLYTSGDYAKAGVPMMPVVRGARSTRRQIFAYSLVLAPLAVVAGVHRPRPPALRHRLDRRRRDVPAARRPRPGQPRR